MGKVLLCSRPPSCRGAGAGPGGGTLPVGLGTALVGTLYSTLGHRRSLSVTTDLPWQGLRGDGGCDIPVALPRAPRIIQGCLQGWRVPVLVVAPAQGHAAAVMARGRGRTQLVAETRGLAPRGAGTRRGCSCRN